MIRIFVFAALVGAAVASAPPPARAADEKLDVVASFSVIGDFARVVGGEHVNVSTLVAPNGDAHVYEPTPADAKAFAAADVILVNGLGFEGFLDRLAETSGASAPVAVLSRGVETIRMTPGASEEAGSAEGEKGDIDPHAFQSIANARIYVANTADAFCDADPKNCEAYRGNAKDYSAKLDALETEVKTVVAAIPATKRTIITSHDAFGYFGHAYGLDFLAPEGISTEAEPSAADVAALIGDIRRRKAAAVFVENISDPRLIEQIAAETGLTLGGALYSDALSEASEPAATYLDMIRHNIATIRGAILGS